MATTTITIRISDDVKSDLDALASDTRRSRSFLAADAVSEYVAREKAIIDGIKRGLADVEAGRLVPHDQAMARLRATIDEVAHRTARAA